MTKNHKCMPQIDGNDEQQNNVSKKPVVIALKEKGLKTKDVVNMNTKHCWQEDEKPHHDVVKAGMVPYETQKYGSLSQY